MIEINNLNKIFNESITYFTDLICKIFYPNIYPSQWIEIEKTEIKCFNGYYEEHEDFVFIVHIKILNYQKEKLICNIGFLDDYIYNETVMFHIVSNFLFQIEKILIENKPLLYKKVNILESKNCYIDYLNSFLCIVCKKNFELNDYEKNIKENRFLYNRLFEVVFNKLKTEFGDNIFGNRFINYNYLFSCYLEINKKVMSNIHIDCIYYSNNENLKCAVNPCLPCKECKEYKKK